MAAKYILSVLALLFAVAATRRFVADGFALGPASRTWFIIAVCFAAVSAWLWTA